MLYSEIVEIYDELASTTKKLEKIDIIAGFLPKLKGCEKYAYLLRGHVFPDYDPRELGISTQLVIKSISRASGFSQDEVVSKFKELGDLGDVAVNLLEVRKQNSLFLKKLTVSHVFESLQKIASIDGAGSVDKKLGIISELLIGADSREACYLVRTLLGDLRIGVADAVLLGSISKAFFPEDKNMLIRVQKAYDLITDFAQILTFAFKGHHAFVHISLIPGRALNVMLATKVSDIAEAFELCGKPAAFEHKYDGFRVVISCENQKVHLFTRRLEEVTSQFPDLVSCVSKYVLAKSFVLDAEVVGFDPKKNKYLPFEAISQRIKRKHNIDELIKKLPVELKVFDVLYVDGEQKVELEFLKRREILEKIIQEVPWKITLSKQIITDSEKEVEKFYSESLKLGEEGIMIKNISSPYSPGRYIGNIAKLKPNVADLDLVIVGGEYGTGKRAGGLTSFIVACRDGEEFLELGKVSSGLKEKASEGTSYGELNDILQPLIIGENSQGVVVKPVVIVSVTYQNIQVSPTYSSGYALRFPRISHYRPERGIHDIATVEDIKVEVARTARKSVKKI